MKKTLFMLFLLTACSLTDERWENNKVTIIDKAQGIYLISTEDKDAGVYKTVQEEGICPHNYIVEKEEAKVLDADWPAFYKDYTIRCLLPVNREKNGNKD